MFFCIFLVALDSWGVFFVQQRWGTDVAAALHRYSWIVHVSVFALAHAYLGRRVYRHYQSFWAWSRTAIPFCEDPKPPMLLTQNWLGTAEYQAQRMAMGQKRLDGRWWHALAKTTVVGNAGNRSNDHGRRPAYTALGHSSSYRQRQHQEEGCCVLQ